MKRKFLKDYLLALLLVTLFSIQSVVLAGSLSAKGNKGSSLDELISETDKSTTETQSDSGKSDTSASDEAKNNQLIDGLKNSVDYSAAADSKIVEKASTGINKVVGIAIQIIAYAITGFMTVSKLLDLFYIAIPVSRKWLANGYMGNAAAAGTPNSTPSGMGMGMGGMGMGGMSMGMGGMGMGGSRYGGMGMGMNGMTGGDSQMAAQNQPARGRIQLVSNAALNAVATESVIGTDGKGQSAFKVYVSDMVVSIIITGVLIALLITGVLSKLGFVIGDFLVVLFSKISF